MPDALLAAGVRPPSRLLLAAFTRIALRRLRQSFRAVRVVGGEQLAAQTAGPLIVSVNHASWWDPLLCLTLARTMLRRRTHYAPISAASLTQYPLFARLGMFPVQQHTARGAVQFLRGAEAVLDGGGVLWTTAQGAFTDVRVRPTVLKPGLGALVHRLPRVTVVPVAVEYTFWNQRLPEVLVAVGEPLVVSDGAARSSAAWSALLAEQLEVVQNELAGLSIQRNPTLFSPLLEGGSGTAGVYGAWQRLRSRLRGDVGSPDHVADTDVR
jgi:1-acyl-sn-glycerol-3-phosphate acyltransferase